MHVHRITLTPGATLHFGSLGFIYTGPTESIGRRSFTRPPRLNVLTGAVGREAFVRGFSDDIIVGMLGPTQHRRVLGLLLTTSPTLPSRLPETSHRSGGSSWSGTPQCTPVDNPATRTTR
jgi:hypothetical protein